LHNFLKPQTKENFQSFCYKNPRIDLSQYKTVALLQPRDKLSVTYLLKNEISKELKKILKNKGYTWLDNINYADATIKVIIIEKLGKANSIIYVKVSIYNKNNILLWEGIGYKKYRRENYYSTAIKALRQLLKKEFPEAK
jgi:hypothetical protein